MNIEPIADADDSAVPASARRLLIDWANEQDGWVRKLATEVLSSRQALSEEVLGLAFDQLLAEKNLSADPALPVPRLELDEAVTADAAEFVIETLAGVDGVNALAADQTIEFNPGLTVLFGENGSGKTGYTRILKCLAAVRTAEVILPNVHDPDAAKTQQATIAYRVGGQPQSLTWAGEEGLSPFTYMGIFDQPAVRLHVDDDLSYVYTPGDLALFPHVTDALTGVRSRLNAAIAERKPSGNPYLSHFTRGTAVYNLIETLGEATDLEALKRLAATSKDDSTKLGALHTKVVALQGETVPAQLSVARARRDLHKKLTEAAVTIESFDATAYNESVAAAAQADTDYATLRGDLFKAAGLAGDGDAVWQAFILGGETYREHLAAHDYPSDGDTCLYCQQVLGPEALVLVRRYRAFANDAARERSAAGRGIATTLTRHVAVIDRGILTEAVNAQLADDQHDPALLAASRLLSGLASQQTRISEGLSVEWDALASLSTEVQDASAPRRDAADELIADLTTKADERKKALEKAQAEHDQLKDRLELNRRLAGITAYVEGAQWAARAGKIERRFTPLLRSLTEAAKAASEQLLNSDFAKHFRKNAPRFGPPRLVSSSRDAKDRLPDVRPYPQVTSRRRCCRKANRRSSPWPTSWPRHPSA